MEVAAGACSSPDVSLLRHDGDDAPAIGCLVASAADSFVLILPRPVSIDRSQYDVIRVTLASGLSAISWNDLDAVLLSDAACLLALPWISQFVSPLTTVACSSALLRVATALLEDVYLGQHVQFHAAGAVLSMFVTSELLAESVRLLTPAYRLSPVPLLGGGAVTAFSAAADPGSVGWVVSRGDASARVVISRQHSVQPRLAFGAADETPSAPARCHVTLSGVCEGAVVEAAAAAQAALAAGGCVLGIASCPFAIARFIVLLKETKVPMFWVGQRSDELYGCLHALAEYCNDDMLREAYDRKAPFVLGNASGEISALSQQDVTCSNECVVVACCPSADFVLSWTFSKPTSNVVLRFQ